MAESSQEQPTVKTLPNGTRIRIYPDGTVKKLKPRTATMGVESQITNMRTALQLKPQPANNYRCIQPFSAQVPSACGDFYLDTKDARTKYVCPKCETPTIMPLF